MILTVQTLCFVFLIVLAAYWIMPIEKMKAVNRELKSLLQILPISRIIKAFTERKSKPGK